MRQSNKQRWVVSEGYSDAVVIQGNSMCKGPGVGIHSAPWSSSIKEVGVAGKGELGGRVRGRQTHRLGHLGPRGPQQRVWALCSEHRRATGGFDRWTDFNTFLLHRHDAEGILGLSLTNK